MQNYPCFEETPQKYSFDDRMDLYLERLSKIAEKEKEFDFIYSTISDNLVWNYNTYKENLSEEDCERFLTIINLCKKRLETALVSQESQEERQEEKLTTIKLTDARRELEQLYEERGNYSRRSPKETEFLCNNYNIPFLEEEPSEGSFEERYHSYLDKMEELVKPGEWDLLYEAISDNLIWKYDQYRSDLTEEHCQRIVALIKMCEENKKTAKIY